jgi:aspartyl-tRNA(Asn)/glutamyl-tRNA(Gln) amidotransferase subunit A
MTAGDVELCFTPATELRRMIQTRAVSPVEVTSAVLHQMERFNPVLNAYCTITADAAMETAREVEAKLMRGLPVGQLAGIPVSIKDLVRTKGVRTTSGSRVFRDYVPDEDAPIAARIRASDAVVVGKTNTPAFGWRASTDNLVFGETRNPWALDRTPGGSSGGASVAVAAGMAPLAIGTDGGGSIRIPAAFCGIFGLKPSFGRVPLYPASGAESLSHAGPMTRTVADAALLLDVIAGPDERDRNSLPAFPGRYVDELWGGVESLRIAWSPDLNFAPIEPEIAEHCASTVEKLNDAGWNVVEDSPPIEDPFPIFQTLYFSAHGGQLVHNIDAWREDLDPGLLEIMERGRGYSGFDVTQANLKRAAFWDVMQQFFSNYDAVITPAVAVSPFELGIVGPESVAGRPVGHLAWAPFSFPFNLTGQPAAIVPSGFDGSGLPVALQIVGRRFDDATVLRVAAAFEALLPWAHHRPPLEYAD